MSEANHWIPQVQQWFNLSPDRLIALTARLEAGSEFDKYGRASLQAIINVIHNRRVHPLKYYITNPEILGAKEIYEITKSPYHAVILGYKQFSCYLPGYNGLALYYKNNSDFDYYLTQNRILRECWSLVDELKAGRLADVTFGADIYFNPNIANQSFVQQVRRTCVFRTRIGNHEFYSQPPHYTEATQVYRPTEGEFVGTQLKEIITAAGTIILATT